MKKLLAAVCVCSMLLCGCQSQGTYLKPYAGVTASKTADVSSMIDTRVWEGFAADLGVVSVDDSENGIDSETLSQIDAKEVFLTGTTDSTVLTAYNIYTQMPPASITKILTALVALQSVSDKDLDQEVTLTDDVNIDVADAQVCGFKPGDKMTLRTLLYCMLIYSGNDAANAVASAVSGGDIPAFCDKMNETAAKLGATQTHFVTPNGLDDPDHYTTAYDLYLIIKEFSKHDLAYMIDSLTSYDFTYTDADGNEQVVTIEPTNEFLTGEVNLPDGYSIGSWKTGTTEEALNCLIMEFKNDSTGDEYVVLVAGADGKEALYSAMTNLINLAK